MTNSTGCIKPIIVDELLIVKLYLEDMLTLEEISKRLDCSPSTIKRRLVKNNISLRSREEVGDSIRFKVNPAEIVYLYNRGYTKKKYLK